VINTKLAYLIEEKPDFDVCFTPKIAILNFKNIQPKNANSLTRNRQKYY